MNVQVWNDKDIDHVEKWAGKTLTIPAKGFIEMDADEAHEFRCQFYPPYIDAGGNQLKSSFKRIRIVAPKKEEVKTEKEVKHICNSCNYDALTEKGLEDHLLARHLDELTDPKVADEIKKKVGRPPKAS